jgi:hypothetical protein
MSQDHDETQNTYDWGGDESHVLPSTARKREAETPRPEAEAGGEAAPTAWEAADDDGPILVSRPEPAPPEPVPPEPMPTARPAPPEPAARRSAARLPRAVPVDNGTKAAAEKVGIVGGKAVGKSYLFQAMVYRTAAGDQSGALTYYLDQGATNLYSWTQSGQERSTTLKDFVRNYEQWERLDQTSILTQRWYRLRLGYRTGIFGQQRSTLDIEFFDGSGEGFFQRPIDDETEPIWRDGYLEARVMVFCLPLWVAFPRSGLSADDLEERDDVLTGFQQVVQNYTDVREKYGRTSPVRTILALTMADDRRTALTKLQDCWVKSFLKSPRTYLRQLRKGRGVARYLDNARRVSEAVRHEFSETRDPMVGRIPSSLEFRGGEPWLIPVSAIEGSRLRHREEGHVDADTWRRLGPPIPVHVELPILVTLCERDNALL